MLALQLGSSQTSFAIAVAAVALAVVLALWLSSVYRRLRRLESEFRHVFEDAAEQNTARMLAEYLTTVRSTASAVQGMKAEHDRLAAVMPTVIRHVGLVRFSPFHDTGGDQSFALALLDGKADGVIVTGLHSRHDSRLYAKPVSRGTSDYTLSPEERAAMDRALGQAERTAVR